MMRSRLINIAAAVSCAALLAPLGAQAKDTYPSAPIKLIVPYSPGGGVDIVGRFLANKLDEAFKQTVIVENKPGASGMIGAGMVARSKPDGLTILLASSGEASINPHLYKDMTYDPAKDLAGISLIAKIPNILSVNPDVPVKNVSELVQYAKTNKLTFSSSGVGNIQGITGELFNKVAGVTILQIPYKGAAPAISDVVAKRVSMTFQPGAPSLPFIQNKQMKPIAVTSTTPIAAFPDVPPIAQTPGFEDFEMVNWYGLFAPAGTPAATVQKLNAAVVKILKDPEFVATLERLGAIPSPMTAEQFTAFRNSESAKFGKVIKDMGITLN